MSRDDVNAPFAGSTWDVGVHRNLKRLRKLPTNELTRRLAGLSMCSLNQRRLWFAYVLDSRSNAYNVPLVWSIEGRLDVQAMKQAWVRLVERHDVLRSIYFPHGEDVYLIALALDSVISQVVIHEAEGIDADPLIQSFVDRPFDLESGMPARCMLMRCGEEKYVMALAFHHIVVDGWSLTLLSNELMLNYEDILRQKPAPTPSPVQYSQFSMWQRTRLDAAVKAREVAFWREKLADLPEPLALAGRQVAHVEGAGRACILPFSLNARLIDSLTQYSVQRGGTLFVVLMAGMQALQYRATGIEKPVVGTTMTGRKDSRFERTIGFFVNTLAIPASVDESMCMDELFEQQRQMLFEAYDHDNLPFDQLMEQLRQDIGHTASPFQWVLELHPSSYNAAPQSSSILVKRRPAGRRSVKYELTFFLTETSSGLECALEFDSARVSTRLALALIDAYRSLLTQALARPDMPLGQLGLTSAQRSDDKLSWLKGPRVLVPESSPASLLAQVVARFPHRTALSDGVRSISFGAMRSKVDALARALVDLELDGDKQLIGVVADRSIESYLVVLACWQAGLGYVPINPAESAQRLKLMLTTANFAVVLRHDAVLAENVNRALGGAVPCLSIEALILQGLEAGPAPDRTPLRTYAVFTSGSTGQPKPCAMSWRSIVNLQMAMEDAVIAGDRQAHRVTINAPLFFDASIQQLMLMYAGCSMYIVPERTRLDPCAFHEFLDRNEISILELTPSHFRMLDGWKKVDTLPALRKVMLGAEDIPLDIWQSLRLRTGLTFFNMYGPTECSVDSTAHRIDPSRPFPTLGRPFQNVDFYCVDEGLNIVPKGLPGELLIAGLGVRDSVYFMQPDATSMSYLPDPWGLPGSRCYRTGDLVRVTEDGEIEFLRRKDGQVKLRGNRIEIGEVAHALRNARGVKDCGVLIEQDEQGVACLVAFIVLQDRELFNEEALLAELRTSLPAYAIPSRCHLVQGIPMKPNGKVDLVRLRASPRVTSCAPSADPGVTLLTAEEKEIGAIWSQVLGREVLDPERSFISLGGHSIQIARLLQLMNERFSLNMRAAQIFQGMSIRDLAARISNSHFAQGPALIEWAPRRKGYPSLFCIHGAGGGVQAYAHLASSIGAERGVIGVASRALTDGVAEHESLETLLDDYASQILSHAGGQPVHLLGWSFGGLLGLGVAQRVIASGGKVLSLEMWDTGWQPNAEPRTHSHALGEAYRSVLNSLLASHEIKCLRDTLGESAGSHWPTCGQDWLAVLHRIFGPDMPAHIPCADDLDRAALLGVQHRTMARAWRAPTSALDIPIHCLWAEDSLKQGRVTRTDWGAFGSRECSEQIVSGDHYSILRPPNVSTNAASLAARLCSHEANRHQAHMSGLVEGAGSS